MAEQDGKAIPLVEGDDRDALARVLMRAGYRVVGAATAYRRQPSSAILSTSTS